MTNYHRLAPRAHDAITEIFITICVLLLPLFLAIALVVDYDLKAAYVVSLCLSLSLQYSIIRAYLTKFVTLSQWLFILFVCTFGIIQFIQTIFYMNQLEGLSRLLIVMVLELVNAGLIVVNVVLQLRDKVEVFLNATR